MGLFKKKEKTHFERDEEGRVVQVTRNGQDVDMEETKMKSAKQLEQEYYKKHPEKHYPTVKKIGRGMQSLDKKIVDYNKRSNIMNPQRSRISSQRYIPRGRKGDYNPFGNLFDMGMSPMSRSRVQQKKKKSDKQYAIIKGKAYPIASTIKSKKSKSKKRKYKLNDPFDFSGWL